ncbi:TetR family transcriptional regulator [Mangrovicoccus sp. HB161399]|uniref:TetR family transcriptional regulator n=1 Tax=Mangrovicoccus sp. HB161399 TaxID=2720392 RepID=UPI0015571A5D|nr:TetR family transcriptional regulator [Mangrovicoccus sp. HB161399]
MARPMTRWESSARTRRALLDAAARLFARDGYAAAAVAAIAAEAGFAKGAFHVGFAPKEAIFLEVLDRIGTEDVRAPAARITAAPDGHAVERCFCGCRP